MNRMMASLIVGVPVMVAAAVIATTQAGETRAAKRSVDYIEGRVTSGASRPEAGVWVIAETQGLPTPYRKIVVTNGQGRFVVPQLPQARYSVWVRGYGLRDSRRVAARPGATLDLRVAKARTARQAAAVFPASYWLSLFQPPETTGTWTSSFKLGCELCHQMGSAPTRGLTRDQYDQGLKKTSSMNGIAAGLGRDRLLDALADWGARTNAGQTPKAPPRPRGVERNFVITQWAWGDTFTYAHDEVATDKRNPRRNANGPIYGVDLANDNLLILDPVKHRARKIKVPTLGGHNTPWCNATFKALTDPGQPEAPVLPSGFGTLGCPAAGGVSAFVGKYDNPANPHNPMMDARGRVWFTTQVRREWGEDLPAFCKTSPVIAKNSHHRQLGYYDPKTGKIQLIDTCYGTHHLQFDAKGVLWLSGDSFVLGRFDPSKYDPARPETLQAAQSFSEVSVDSNGDGLKDRSIRGFNYGIIPNPRDGSVWTAQPSTGARGLIVRYDPSTDMFEAYAPPAPGAGPRGVDVDTKGIIWVALGGSGHLGMFDRSKCRQSWGTGEQCPEGWTIFRSPGPLMQTSPEPQNLANADFHYYLWVDQFNTLGLGKDVVILNGTGSDSLLAFKPSTRRFTVIRVPYPLNLFTRGLDGRIDDPKAGWKGRGLWFDNGLDPLIHSEQPQSYVGKVQVRPNPLAR